jgi:predicted nucleic acid-binding Zn ribbon protein
VRCPFVAEDYGALHEALEAVTRRLGLNFARETGAVWSRWTEVVGPVIASHAHPSSLRRGVLRVRTESPVWATEIGYLSGEIRDKINSMLGMELVSQVRVWTGPAPALGSRLPSPRERLSGARRTSSRRDHDRDPKDALKAAKAAWARTTRARLPQRR